MLAGNIDLTSKVTGTLAVGNGGTGLASYTAGDIIQATGATTLAAITKGSNNTVLQVDSGGTLQYGTVTNDMLAGNIDLTSKVTGTLAVGNGGTGLTAIGSKSTVLQVDSGGTLKYGTVTNAMLAGSIDLTSKVTGTLPVGNGGTGQTSATNGGYLKGNGTSFDVYTVSKTTTTTSPYFAVYWNNSTNQFYYYSSK